MNRHLTLLFLYFLAFPFFACAQNGETFLQFEGKEGPGKGKHIVLVAGDDEYRSEESMPMLAKKATLPIPKASARANTVSTVLTLAPR